MENIQQGLPGGQRASAGGSKKTVALTEGDYMHDIIEYQIFVGCNDSQLKEEIVSEQELIEMVTGFFERKKINFSMFSNKGGYTYDTGDFVSENSICVNIIGEPDLDIVGLAKSLSMYMNQEYVLVTRTAVTTSFR